MGVGTGAGRGGDELDGGGHRGGQGVDEPDGGGRPGWVVEESGEGEVYAILLQLPAARELELKVVHDLLKEAVGREQCIFLVVDALGKLPVMEQLGIADVDPLLLAYLAARGRLQYAARDGTCSLLQLPVVKSMSKETCVRAVGTALTGTESAGMRKCGESKDADVAELLRLPAAQLFTAADVLQLLQLAMVKGHVEAIRGLVVLPAAQPGALSLGEFWDACAQGVNAGFEQWCCCLSLHPYGQQLTGAAAANLLQHAVLRLQGHAFKLLLQLPGVKQLGGKDLAQLLRCVVRTSSDPFAAPLGSSERDVTPRWLGGGDVGCGIVDQLGALTLQPYSSELPEVLCNALQEVPQAGSSAQSNDQQAAVRILNSMGIQLLKLPAASDIATKALQELIMESAKVKGLGGVNKALDKTFWGTMFEGAAWR